MMKIKSILVILLCSIFLIGYLRKTMSVEKSMAGLL